MEYTLFIQDRYEKHWSEQVVDSKNWKNYVDISSYKINVSKQEHVLVQFRLKIFYMFKGKEKCGNSPHYNDDLRKKKIKKKIYAAIINEMT